MIWLVNYFRRAFCKHDWSVVRENRVVDGVGDDIGRLHSTYCVKCMYVRKWKVNP